VSGQRPEALAAGHHLVEIGVELHVRGLHAVGIGGARIGERAARQGPYSLRPRVHRDAVVLVQPEAHSSGVIVTPGGIGLAHQQHVGGEDLGETLERPMSGRGLELPVICGGSAATHLRKSRLA
jgi:hypothetical protein